MRCCRARRLARGTAGSGILLLDGHVGCADVALDQTESPCNAAKAYFRRDNGRVSRIERSLRSGYCGNVSEACIAVEAILKLLGNLSRETVRSTKNRLRARTDRRRLISYFQWDLHNRLLDNRYVATAGSRTHLVRAVTSRGFAWSSRPM
jgi:hypothetical protein